MRYLAFITICVTLFVATAPAADTPTPRRDHWSFKPINRYEAPRVNNKTWVRNPIDAFILARLEAKRLSPSPQADRATLIRRLYIDLIGLTPPVEAVDAFVNDKSPDAYEKLVDRILQSPHYGERWGRHWLDQARYADSHGYSIDGGRTMWPYRDWVINALNNDMPFDRFTIEQLAGDLLPNATIDQQVATGFHRNTLVNQEGGSDREQFRVEATVDRVNTTGAVWLGLTIACAQCHDHKYDPVSQREYFELFAFFNNAEDANGTGPTVRIADADRQTRIKLANDQLAAAERALKEHDTQQAKRRQAWEQSILAQRSTATWTVLEPKQPRVVGTSTLKVLDDHSVLAGGKAAAKETFEVVATTDVSGITAVRLEALTDPSLPKTGPGRSSAGNFVLTSFEVEAAPAAQSDKAQRIKFKSAVADHQQANLPVTGALDPDPEKGWAPEGYARHENRTAVFTADRPFGQPGSTRLRIRLRHDSKYAGYTVGRFRISVTTSPNPGLNDPGALADAVAVPADKRSKAQRDLINKSFAATDTKRKPLVDRVAALKKQRDDLNRSTPTAMVMRDIKSPRTTHVMIRGDFLRKGDVVKPNVPSVLPDLPVAGTEGNRLDLARWLVDKRNPLTARVTVNRVWLRYFGRGLVETEEDFGLQGTPPTHPKLLDWLAHEFMHGETTGRPWSFKALHKLIVTSATYRQSSRMVGKHADQLFRGDPRNDLLGRQARFRVEAEVVRDLGLSASGMLTPTIGGPSVFPPQPDGVYAFTQNRKSWRASTGPNRYRRGMYTFFYRSAPYPMLTTFDTPRFNVTCTRRARSNTPLQALTQANSEASFEIAQGLAARILREAPADETARVAYAFRLCLARAPQPNESAIVLRYLKSQRAAFGANPDAAAALAPSDLPTGVAKHEAAAWTATARVMLNLDEFITRE